MKKLHNAKRAVSGMVLALVVTLVTIAVLSILTLTLHTTLAKAKNS